MNPLLSQCTIYFLWKKNVDHALSRDSPSNSRLSGMNSTTLCAHNCCGTPQLTWGLCMCSLCKGHFLNLSFVSGPNGSRHSTCTWICFEGNALIVPIKHFLPSKKDVTTQHQEGKWMFNYLQTAKHKLDWIPYSQLKAIFKHTAK